MDPGALAQAKAAPGGFAGLLSGLESPMPNYRFDYLIRHAFELVSELRSLEQQFLTIREKKDTEGLALPRSRHQCTVLALAKKVKKHEKQETLKAIDVISAARTQQEKAMEYYLLLTADKDKIKIPGIGESWKGVPQEIHTIKGDIPMSSLEKEELDKGDTASDVYLAAGVASAVGDVVGVILDFAVKAQPMGARCDMCDVAIKSSQKDIENSGAKEDWLRMKNTGEQLYNRLDSTVTMLSRQTYQLTLEMANVVQCALHFEHSLRFPNSKSPDSQLAKGQTDYWEQSPDGQLAGEASYLDLKRMELLHMENCTHDFEITKNVSIRQLNQCVLLQLREQGRLSVVNQWQNYPDRIILKNRYAPMLGKATEMMLHETAHPEPVTLSRLSPQADSIRCFGGLYPVTKFGCARGLGNAVRRGILPIDEASRFPRLEINSNQGSRLLERAMGSDRVAGYAMEGLIDQIQRGETTKEEVRDFLIEASGYTEKVETAGALLVRDWLQHPEYTLASTAPSLTRCECNLTRSVLAREAHYQRLGAYLGIFDIPVSNTLSEKYMPPYYSLSISALTPLTHGVQLAALFDQAHSSLEDFETHKNILEFIASFEWLADISQCTAIALFLDRTLTVAPSISDLEAYDTHPIDIVQMVDGKGYNAIIARFKAETQTVTVLWTQGSPEYIINSAISESGSLVVLMFKSLARWTLATQNLCTIEADYVEIGQYLKTIMILVDIWRTRFGPIDRDAAMSLELATTYLRRNALFCAIDGDLAGLVFYELSCRLQSFLAD
ncbi:hypothetical protein BDV27DRAFT_161237 [Aspergillus caelatus]|uniref:Tc toxin complex TcA C-terminal TcB-binding domain-containing protein n=1 Tax=Aspergillus caelatus TaxID=61420 RepID=A0A5N6ZU30_9EURO|nr:uncharacterized protein BDV27DRAFT_161237 [Aspergillus caelatus]KAE8360915.1 hypothetical protein BDV27DRAFT_161237 [Aspergillus caelatus]